MISARLCALSVATLLLALAGCGSSPKAVTKAQYQAELASSGRAVTLAGQQLGKSTAAADFSGAVANLQKVLREGEKKLAALEPPANARPANKHLAQALGDLAHALEPVKAASSMVKAREALGQLGRSAAIKAGRAAILELNRLGYAAAGL